MFDGAEVTRVFGNGTTNYRLGDAEWGVTASGRVYWANDAGWDLVMSSDKFRDDGALSIAGADYYAVV